ncbi:hypothetical protein A3K34_00565 [candidate division WWE3 bacterium RIFOXYC1_FULL_40_10]|uniref:Sortase n=1 Tax=candidate division WWE3 bacterium RIFOXYA2_FULL_46_9 TaxID=1802636 RepID=A0A1F4W3D5_UNCKA|nr:MAG: hypothetical protein A3K58_00565 [candidate division WWE3 bacterium RIFOXYB1_FULL_40_22]OGC61373.1 MAG: hypothetical protein A3K37_00565 [candidate division WWE3 bacterium RIFOXYA1_FULL_40_11]OGC63927.1 MAG: hypothetical protein A2264_02470 [candidate division WWE3 bacterium RIFOXYA2_FULL_46_9]OGC65363.1 MAG: hypothetical protein A2326_04850 [candidate division WWE3 bacterium RIFOXYB2_FULL_41_6]OGC65756.1 MAG: hypothetical protein A3K34_00565 [candidate division WWE3 bacterium RIFOXYC1_
MNLTTLKKHYFSTLPFLFILIGLTLLFLSLGPLIGSEILYYLGELTSRKYILDENAAHANDEEQSVFSNLLGNQITYVTPPNKDFSLVIERLNISAPVVKDVTVFDRDSYNEALKGGIAHSISSNYPSSDPGNVYLFAHASLNFWELGKYATVFNLLRKVRTEDLIHVFYKGDDYIYKVIDKEVYKGWDVRPLTRLYIEPILTLQTCDPPGTTLNRLVVTAKLMEIKKLSDTN